MQQSYVDRPTVSYAPQTRPDFIRNLTVPLPPTSVLYLMQAGYPVDLVFDLTLDAINGIQGRTVSGGQVRPASPEYQRVVEILRMAQLSGSVGTLCAIILLMASEHDPLFLQVKQARPSVLEAYAGKSLHANHGQRVVHGCRMMQSASDIFLGWTEGDLGRHFYVRQLKDMKIKPLVEVFTPSVMLQYAELCGWTLAHAHARSGEPVKISGYLGKSDSLRQGHRRLLRRLRRPERTRSRSPHEGRRAGKLEVFIESE